MDEADRLTHIGAVFETDLPISAALPQLLDAIKAHKRAVLQAPPGAGKTTVVPLALMNSNLINGRILMLEPRRLAARAAADRMATTLGEKIGHTVGYTMRGDKRVSNDTRIEVVTEGVLTRMVQTDPSLDGIGAVIFDEFHERSLNADLGLALVWEARQALRDDLCIIVMSATLDAEPVANLLDDAPLVTSQGRSFDVTPIWLDKPVSKSIRFEQSVARLVEKSVSETDGSVLVFLPGEGEIRRVESALNLPPDCSIHPLFGAMPFAAQQKAIAPALTGRKVVLATSIAETSLTIQDVTVVVDAGRSRRARFDPNSGMSKLVTENVTQAEATQRMGRAGRVQAGRCYKHWTKGQDGAMATFPPPEIAAADLSGLALELALWGSPIEDLAFLTRPPEGALATAKELLTKLGALHDGKLTPHGKAIAKIPTHPRLAHMLATGGRNAADVAAVLGERDIMIGQGSDISARLRVVRGQDNATVNAGALKRIKLETKRLRNFAQDTGDLTDAQLIALAYPDRVGLRRDGDAPRFILSGGKGAHLDPHDPLAQQRLIVATDLDGDTREAKIRQAIAISETELRQIFGLQIQWVNTCHWSKRDRKIIARKQERFGHLVLTDQRWNDATDDEKAQAMLDGVRDLGFKFSKRANLFRARVALARKSDPTLPDLSEQTLLDTLDVWLLPFLSNVTNADQWKTFDATPALTAMLDWTQQTQLDASTPPAFETPMGRKIPIDYSGDVPAISLRIQEMFGTTIHPTVAGNPLQVTLLSPAQRPLQTTMDIPAFWASSYADVRKDMRGRYPRHPWPEDPTKADPTLRAKPRGT